MRGLIGRRLFHILGGSFFPVLAFFLPLNLILLFLVIATFFSLVFDLARMLFPVINSWALFSWIALKGEERRGLTGSTFLLLSSLFVFYFFEKEIAIISLLFLSLGDPLASIVGERWGRRRLMGKSLEGGFAFFFTALTVGFILSPILGLTSLQVFLGAMVGSVIELLPLPLNDNLIIPPAVAGVIALVV